MNKKETQRERIQRKLKEDNILLSKEGLDLFVRAAETGDIDGFVKTLTKDKTSASKEVYEAFSSLLEEEL